MIILGGQRIDVPGVQTVSWVDDPKRAPKTPKVTPRARALRSIFLHTTHGYVCHSVKPGKGPKSTAWAEARYQVSSPREASFDCVVGQDGIVVWQNDPYKWFTWHATQVNGVSLGIEMAQDLDGTLYQDQLDSACALVSFLCVQLGIQKQTPWDHASGRPYAGRIARLDPGAAGIDCVGAFGHRNVWHGQPWHLTPERGPGDPGDAVFAQLVSKHRFECFDYNALEDKKVWSDRQRRLGIDADGLPLSGTRDALRRAGYANGIYVDGNGV